VKRAPALLLAAAGAALAQGQPYTLDITHTFATFEALHLGTSTLRGRFDKKEGTVLFDRAAKTGRVEIAVETASVSTGVDALDRKLRSAEVFNSAEHARATFVGDTFSFAGDRVSAVAGTLTIAGKAQPVTLKATNFNCYTNPLFRREVCGGDFEAVLRRSDFGIAAGLPAIVPDEIRLLVQVEAIRQ